MRALAEPYFAKISRQNLETEKNNKLRGPKVARYPNQKLRFVFNNFKKCQQQLFLKVEGFARKIVSVEKILASGNGKSCDTKVK